MDPSDRSNASPAVFLPRSNTVTYDGVAYYPLTSIAEGQVELLSDMVLVADFGASTVRGQMTNFVALTEDRYSGSLEIEESPIDRSADFQTQLTYVADLNGSIVSPDGVVYESGAVVAGEFAGGGTDFIRGYVRGVFFVDGQRVALNDPVFVGEAR